MDNTETKTIWGEPELNIQEIDNTPVESPEEEVLPSAEITQEEFNEATNINTTSGDIAKVFKDNYNVDISIGDVSILMDVVNRMKNKDTVLNPYAELPVSIREAIRNTFKDITDVSDTPENMSNLNFLAKEFIVGLYHSAEIGQILDEYNEAVSQIQERTDKEHVMVDYRYDGVLEKITNAYKEVVEDPEKNPEVAQRVMKAYEFFTNAISMKRIITAIDERPSILNRTYKDIRYFQRWCMDYDSKWCCDGNTKIKFRTLEAIYGSLRALDLDEETAKTICGLLVKELAPLDKNDVHDKYYAYYMSDIIFMLHKTTLFGEVSSKMNEAINELKKRISALRDSKELRNKKKRR